MLMLVLSCWQGQQGYNLSPRIPDERADEWHIIANAPTVALSGKWDKGIRFACVCSMSSFIWAQVFLAVWADTKEELKSFYRSRPPSRVLSWALFYGRWIKFFMCILSGKEGYALFFHSQNHLLLYMKWNEGSLAHAFCTGKPFSSQTEWSASEVNGLDKGW